MTKFNSALPGILFCFALIPAHAAPSEEAATTATIATPSVATSETTGVATELYDPLPRIATVDLTLPPDDLWERIRHGFGMPNLSNELVSQQQAWYLARPEYLRRVVERSRRYMYHIVAELEKRGMPTELALLPIVESAYNPMAYSPAHASGMWQFIPSTGKSYSLEQNWWVDQRRDIIASTSAALDYLQTIYELHGDWHLALASYNWGENAVARAITKNRARGLPTDYMSLTMPTETRNYVPKLQALKNIIAQPELFKVKLDPIANKPYFVTVEKPADMDVAVAAKLAEISSEEFLALNPAYNRPVMPAKGNLSFVLPAEHAEIFQSNLESFDKRLTNWRPYTLKNGETLNTVAARHGISMVRLKQVNGINSKMKVRAGNTLLVPAGAEAPGDLSSVNLPMVKLNVPKHAKQGKSKGKKKATGRSVKKKLPAKKRGKSK